MLKRLPLAAAPPEVHTGVFVRQTGREADFKLKTKPHLAAPGEHSASLPRQRRPSFCVTLWFRGATFTAGRTGQMCSTPGCSKTAHTRRRVGMKRRKRRRRSCCSHTHTHPPHPARTHPFTHCNMHQLFIIIVRFTSHRIYFSIWETVEHEAG